MKDVLWSGSTILSNPNHKSLDLLLLNELDSANNDTALQSLLDSVLGFAGRRQRINVV